MIGFSMQLCEFFRECIDGDHCPYIDQCKTRPKIPMKGNNMSDLMKALKKDLTLAMKSEIRVKKDYLQDCGYDEIPTEVAARLLEAINQKMVSRAIISMCPEIKKKPKDTTDEDVIKLLKRYINTEKERELYMQRFLAEEDVQHLDYKQLKKLVKDTLIELGDKVSSDVIKVAQGYLPEEVTDGKIEAWIRANIDFTAYKNKMQAMGPIMKEFQGSNGSRIKDILLKEF